MSLPRALLIVNSPGIEVFYRNALSSMGLDVTSVRDGENALAQLKTPQPIIVVLDLMLPGMSGVEFIRNLKVQRAAVAPPVIVLPCLDAELAAAATAAGATRVLTREQDPLRTLTLLAHTQARHPGTPNPPPLLAAAAWLPAASGHLLNLHNAMHAITRDSTDPVAWRALLSETHGLAEMLVLAGEPGLAELALAMEAFVLGLRATEQEMGRSAIQILGQSVDFISSHLEHFSPGRVPSATDSHVLVVDDEPSVCMLVSAALEIAGIRAEVAASPSACLAAVEKAKFDLVILDIGLPEMSGFDLCTKIRGTPGHQGVPILFLTGQSSFQNRAKSVLTGGNDFIGKPFHPLELGLKVLLWTQLARIGKG